MHLWTFKIKPSGAANECANMNLDLDLDDRGLFYAEILSKSDECKVNGAFTFRERDETLPDRRRRPVGQEDADSVAHRSTRAGDFCVRLSRRTPTQSHTGDAREACCRVELPVALNGAGRHDKERRRENVHGRRGRAVV